VELSDARTRSSASRSLSLLGLLRDVNAFYFGVLRWVAKGNTGGVTGAEEQAREGDSRPLIGCVTLRTLCQTRFHMNINETWTWHH